MRIVSRRRFTRYAGAFSFLAATGGMSAALSACRSSGGGGMKGLSAGAYDALDPRKPANFTTPLRLPGPDGGTLGIFEMTGNPIEIAVRRSQGELLRGKKTDLLGYETQAGGKNFVNPVFRVKRGTEVAARLTNSIDEPTIIHWHGLHVDWRNDGHPSYAVGRGAAYDYRFTVQNRGGAYWFHPHPHGLSGKQTYLGLAGFMIVEDDDELRLRESLDLTLGVTDIPLVIQDKLFSDSGGLVYASTDMERFMGFMGDTVVVNRTVNPSLDVDSRVYRLRVLNASTARSYRLQLMKGNAPLPFQVIGTDGGLLAQPARVSEVFVSPAERVDLIVDLRGLAVGDVVFLSSGAFDPMHNEAALMGDRATATPSGGSMPGMPGMGGGGMTATPESRLIEGDDFYLLKLTVRRQTAYDRPLPETLSRITPLPTEGLTPRPIALSAANMRWLINGEQFDMERELFRTRANTVEVWDIANAEMSMAHPMHLHGFPFQVVERRNSPRQVSGLVVDGKNRLSTDLGWKDTVLVWPGETVRIAIDFTNTFAGEQLFLFHCHNLEHEDGGMMANYRVV